MVWIIHPCWPEQARWLLKVLRVDLKSPKGLHQGGGFDCTGLAWDGAVLLCLVFTRTALAVP